ncbi:MAG: hypothetical protein M1833_003242 [Piccolia ochrophora]|nr:MAG: hypothetical protein M1833_003242 [Piccolia ochrophora]
MSLSQLDTVKREAEDLLEQLRAPNVDLTDRATRLDLLAKAQGIYGLLEDPKEAMFRHFTNFSQIAALRTLMKMGVLEKIPREGCITAKELSAKMDTDEALTIRLMRMLTSTRVFAAVKEDEYAHTRLSLAYLDGFEVDFYKLMIEEALPVMMKLPEYLTSHDVANISDPKHNPFAWGFGREGKHYYEALLEFPERLALFNRAMSTQEKALPVQGMFPFASLETSGQNDDRPIIVDVGGGRGHSLIQIKDANPSWSGRMILQDRQAVLDAVPNEDLPGIEKMTIDFFQPQPVQNARAYYLRRIMHNWPDAECRKILQNIVPAMAPDSRVLIAEMVVPDNVESVDLTVYWMDLTMLLMGGKERTEKDWSALLDSAGLKLLKIWRSSAGAQTVLEACLKNDG